MQSKEKQKLEEIRKTSINIDELIIRLQKFWLEYYDIQVHFEEYPNKFEEKISNSHNAPEGYPTNWDKDGNLPKGYPGWRGNWAGTVISRYDLGFSDLTRGPWSHYEKPSIVPVPWLRLGTGSSGNTFRIDGMVFIYDFPAMHKEFKNTKGQFNVLEQQYIDTLETYEEEFLTQQQLYIDSQKEIETLTLQLAQIEKVEGQTYEALKKAKEYYYSEFAKTHQIPIPLPKTPFVANPRVQRMIKEKGIRTANPLPKTETLVQRLQLLVDEMDKYAKENAEKFI